MEFSRHPSEYFIKYLLTLTRSEAQDDAWIKFSIQSAGFPAPSNGYLSSLRDKLYQDLPVDYQPSDRYNRDSVKYLRKHEIWSLHNPDTIVHACTKLLGDTKARKIVEQLLLGRIDPKEVAKKVNSRLETYYTESIIQTYSHYYWNTSLLRMADWISFFEAYESSEESNALAVLQGGPSVALYATGFPQHLESKDMLREMAVGLFFDFKDWATQERSLTKTKALTNLAKAATQIDVRMSEADSALRDSLKAFEAFRMEHAQKGVRSIEDVAPKGNFTESGYDIKELPKSSEPEKD